MVYYANDGNLNEVKQLWQNCFGDDEAYTDFYFKNRYKSNFNLIAYADEKVVSSAQFYPFEMTYFNSTIKTEYVLGVCTDPLYRRYGYAKHILLTGMNNAFNNNILVQTLIPADKYLFDIYSKYGFVSMFNIEKKVLYRSNFKDYEGLGNVVRYKSSDFSNLFNFYNNWYRSEALRVIKTADDFNFTINESIFNKYDIFLHKTNKIVDGFAVLSLYNGLYTIKEILYYDESIRNKLICKIFSIVRVNKIMAIMPVNGRISQALGMARVINAKKILEVYSKANPTANFSIKLVDSIIEDNNHIFHVENSKIFVDYVENYDVCMDIGTFTHSILGYKSVDNWKVLCINNKSYMNLMLN